MGEEIEKPKDLIKIDPTPPGRRGKFQSIATYLSHIMKRRKTVVVSTSLFVVR